MLFYNLKVKNNPQWTDMRLKSMNSLTIQPEYIIYLCHKFSLSLPREFKA